MRMETPEETLALAAANGDADAFSALIERSYDRLFSLAWRLTGTQADAEDLTHDICLSLPRKIKHFRGDSRWSTWLYRVTVNAAHDRRRKAQTYARKASEWGEVETLRQAEATEAQASAAWLTTAMAALPQDLRDTLALTVTEGVTQAQAAVILDISEGSVAWRMSQVKKHLKALAAEDQI